MKGTAALPIIVVIVVILAVFLIAGSFLKENKESPAPSGAGPAHQEKSEGGHGMKKPFYSKDDISLQHYWPGDESFSNEETEILLFNESSSNLEVKSFDLTYAVEGKTYPHKSGTWEKFPSLQSWDRIEYINISKPYYQGQPLVLARGEKGKLHWHIQFGPNPLSGRQTVTINLTLMKDGQSIAINETLTRSSGSVYSIERH